MRLKSERTRTQKAVGKPVESCARARGPSVSSTDAFAPPGSPGTDPVLRHRRPDAQLKILPTAPQCRRPSELLPKGGGHPGNLQNRLMILGKRRMSAHFCNLRKQSQQPTVCPYPAMPLLGEKHTTQRARLSAWSELATVPRAAEAPKLQEQVPGREFPQRK